MSLRDLWRKRQRVWRECWYCDGLFRFPKYPGLHGETPYHSWYCPGCRKEARP